jgi:beta-glucosidase
LSKDIIMAEYRFPENFLWGAATAAHQVEGDNSGCESWVLETLPETIYREPSGIACDHFHRYPEDIKLLKSLGFNSYRRILQGST